MKNKKAFTLIEVMVVMAIIAVLAVLIIGAIQLARRTSTETTHRSNAKTVQTALERQYAQFKEYCDPAPVVGSGQLDCDAPTLAALGNPVLTDTACDVQVACSLLISNGACIQAIAAQTYTINAYDHSCSTVIDTYQLQ